VHNRTVLASEVSKIRGSVINLSVTVDGNRNDVTSLTNSVGMITRADQILEEKVRKNEDAMKSNLSVLNRELSRLSRGATATRSLFDDALKNITTGVRTLKWEAEANSTSLQKSVKTMEKSFTFALFNVSNKMSQIQSFAHGVQTSLEDQGEAFSEDFSYFKKSIDFAKTKYDHLKNSTDYIESDLNNFKRSSKNFTTTFVKLLNSYSLRIDETEDDIKRVDGNTKASMENFMTDVGVELLNLNTADKELDVEISSFRNYHEAQTIAEGGRDSLSAYF
jgi:hypothetical protein